MTPRTDLYSYRNDFNFRSKEQLLTEIQRHTRKGGGLGVKALKESWKEAPTAIEELEKEGHVLVTRTAKDGQLRMVFWNEIKPDEESGGEPAEKGACFSSDRRVRRGLLRAPPRLSIGSFWTHLVSRVPGFVALAEGAQ